MQVQVRTLTEGLIRDRFIINNKTKSQLLKKADLMLTTALDITWLCHADKATNTQVKLMSASNQQHSLKLMIHTTNKRGRGDKT